MRAPRSDGVDGMMLPLATITTAFLLVLLGGQHGLSADTLSAIGGDEYDRGDGVYTIISNPTDELQYKLRQLVLTTRT